MFSSTDERLKNQVPYFTTYHVPQKILQGFKEAAASARAHEGKLQVHAARDEFIEQESGPRLSPKEADIRLLVKLSRKVVPLDTIRKWEQGSIEIRWTIDGWMFTMKVWVWEAQLKLRHSVLQSTSPIILFPKL